MPDRPIPKMLLFSQTGGRRNPERLGCGCWPFFFLLACGVAEGMINGAFFAVVISGTRRNGSVTRRNERRACGVSAKAGVRLWAGCGG